MAPKTTTGTAVLIAVAIVVMIAYSVVLAGALQPEAESCTRMPRVKLGMLYLLTLTVIFLLTFMLR